MQPRALLVAATVSALFLPPAMVFAAPGQGPGPGGAAPVAPPASPAPAAVGEDRNHDRVADDLEPRLRAADASEPVAVIVTGLASAEARGLVGAFRLRHELRLIDGFAATMTAGQAKALARQPGVRRVEEDGVVHALDDATDRDFGATAARAAVPGLDGSSLDGSGVGICVIDTGVDPNHEQIAPRAVTFIDYVNGRAGAYDDHGHGTHVASIAAGDGAGGADAATFKGVAPAAGLWAAKVLNSQGSGADSDVAAAIQWCHEQDGVRVLSLSLGSGPTDGQDAVSLAVDNAVRGGDVVGGVTLAGDVVVVAAGNSGDAPGTISAPGVAAEATTVGAVADYSAPAGTTRRDNGIWLASFSSRGPTPSGLTKPDISAPGVSVTAADAGTTSGYVTMSGTSMATPYVSGAVALALEVAPTATPAQVKAALMDSAHDVGAGGKDHEWGAGLVDVLALVDRLSAQSLGSTAFPTTMRDTTRAVPAGGQTTLNIDVPDNGLAVPLVAMVTLTEGRFVCDIYCQLGLSAGEWSPDLDLELRDPDGVLIADSQCSLSGVSCRSGRQETVAVLPGKAGTYTLRVYAWPEGSGAGSRFDLDVFTGPLAGGQTPDPDPEPVPNVAPVADAGPATRTVRVNKKTKQATITLNGSATDADGTVTSLVWVDGAEELGSSTTSPLSVTVTEPVGTYTFTLTATDDDGATGSDSVTVTVRR